MMNKICCVTGNRPQKFPWRYGRGAEMERYRMDMWEIVEQFIDEGYDYFISGGALGVDQDFAETVIALKDTHPEIKLEIAVPCRTQAARWTFAEQERYRAILKRADYVNVLSEVHTPSCMQKRNEYMVDKSELVLGFWNGIREGGTFNTLNYAKRNNKTIRVYYLANN